MMCIAATLPRIPKRDQKVGSFASTAGVAVTVERLWTSAVIV